MKVVFASRNEHKLEQVRLLLPGIQLIPVDEVAPDLEMEEPFDTFEENAFAKARAVVNATGLPAIADDSGIEVDALDGAPGVRSARYAGDDATDRDNNLKLVEHLQHVSEENRTARYRCVAVMLTPDGKVLRADGSCEGRIVLEPRGNEGFGYDPHFEPLNDSRTMAEIPLNEKLGFSHRGRAFRGLAHKLGL